MKRIVDYSADYNISEYNLSTITMVKQIIKFMKEKQPTSTSKEGFLVPLSGIHAQTWRCSSNV